jgi:Protein of unknown function (DUF3025)
MNARRDSVKIPLEWNRTNLLQSGPLSPLHPLLSLLDDEAFPLLDDYNALLQIRPVTTQSGLPLKFVAHRHGKLPFEAQYEPRCHLTGEVQTRERNWHDLFNALVWLTFPKTKAAINARHYRALVSDASVTNQRGSIRDVNTLIDESGVIVACANRELGALLRDFKWKELFWQRREDVQAQMGFYIFGHGLYEKAMRPYTGLTGQGLILDVAPEFFGRPQDEQLAHLDIKLAKYLINPAHGKSTRELTPVPLLGIPGWATTQCAEYYDDTDYFRPGRRISSHA